MGYFKQFYGTSGGASKARRGPITIEISGADELQDIIKKIPELYAKKPVLATFRKAATQYKKAVSQNIPSVLKPLMKIFATKAGKGQTISLRAGMFGRKGFVTLKDGREYDIFYPLYWFNYGTYENRDSSHAFIRARKAISSGWSGGIKPRKFMETSWAQSKSQIQETVDKEFEIQTMKLLNKYAVKD